MKIMEYTCGHHYTQRSPGDLAPPYCEKHCVDGRIVFAADMWAVFDCGHHVDVAATQISRHECLKEGCPGRLRGFTCFAPGDYQQETGRKFDDEKPAMDLMPPLMELEVCKVLTFGAQKYDEDNWRQVQDLHKRYRSAAKRHINALRRGELYDEESGCHHAAHAVCCLMFMGEIDLEKEGGEA